MDAINKHFCSATLVRLLIIRFLIVSFIIFPSLVNGYPGTDISVISTEQVAGAFTLSSSGRVAPVYISSSDHAGVRRVLEHFRSDILHVSGARPDIFTDEIPEVPEIIIISTLGKDPVTDKLVQSGKLSVGDITGKRETFLIQVLEQPLPHIDRALVITGSDKRGTVYGMYEISRQIGVSPWYWWADVPVERKTDIYVKPERFTLGEPKVTYRGIFINDEAPALSGWAYEKFGGFNAQFYEHVFELILRLRGNFRWPAMWGRAFYVDDPVNPELADEYGIVIGTSHHEPMMRAHAEWARFGSGPWNYEANEARLREFWREGIERMGDYESIVTLAIRADGDEPMTEEANIALLQRIVKEQREILVDVTGRELESIPQVWALYKEVQEYYDRGMRVPEDITLLLCDDNWGNIRKLPQLNEEPRPGGYGIYYHYDYVGGPRNYKWLNTNQISRVWEQMHLAWEYGATRIWIVNVGDIKPMEFPISFFLDYAWDPKEWPAERLPEYARQWAEEQFGAEYAEEIAGLLAGYTRFNSRRKPELLAPDTYSLSHYREADTIVADYNRLAEQAQQIATGLPPEYHDAFYQLVLHPIQACSNLNEMYVTVAKNRLYNRQRRAATNLMADKARQLYDRDADITDYYHTVLAGGKWNHMMAQTHIGYTYWQQPDQNSMPKVERIKLPKPASMGIQPEGSDAWWPEADGTAMLPAFDPWNRQQYYIEVFNRGRTPFTFTASSSQPWVRVKPANGKIDTETRLWASIDWNQVPPGIHTVPITITGPKESRAEIQAIVHNPDVPMQDLEDRFIESNGCISIEAEHYTRAVNTHPITWQRIPGLGRTLSAMTPFPATAPAKLPAGDSPRLEYRCFLFSQGEVKVTAYLSPTLDFHNDQTLRYGISFDNEQPQIINMHADKTFQDWEESVRNNIVTEGSVHTISEPGRHVLKFWVVDPGIVLQKLVIDTGGAQPTYLGPPESFFMSVEGGR